MNQQSQDTPPIRSVGVWMPYAVLLLSLGVSAAATMYVYRSIARDTNLRFQHAVDEARQDIAVRMDSYVAHLRSASALFAASEEVTRDEWQMYVDRLRLEQLSPGIQGFGFAKRVARSDEQTVLEELRTNVDSKIKHWPEHNNDERYTIIYLEPTNPRNLAAFGYDMYSDPVRRAAMARARDEAAAIASGKVRLLQELDDVNWQAGFVLYVPVYAEGAIPDTVEERRRQIIGFVYSPYRTADLMHGIFRNALRRTVRLNIYDADQKTPQSLLFRSSEVVGYRARFSRDVKLEVAGRTWTIEFYSLPNFDIETGHDLTPIVGFGGLTCSLLLFAFLRSQSRARKVAESIASELRQSERALRISEARFRRLAESNLIAVVFCEINGRITGGNGEFFRLIGHDREDVLSGRVRMDALTAPEHKNADALAMAQLRSHGVADPYDKEMLRVDGARVPVLFGIAMLEGSDFECVGFCIDLSESKQAAMDLQRAKEQAERANRAKDQFLAILSHELRTPLTPVLAVATAAQRDATLSEQARADFAVIRRNVELEARLIDDLLDITSLARGKIHLHLETVDLHQVLRHALDVCASEEVAMKGLNVQLELRARRHHTRGDPARLQQVFWNLLRNAAKFTPPGGNITVFSRDADDEAHVVAGVRDTGVGIDADLLPRIFDAFEQGEVALARKLGGLGLGLAISKGLVIAHGGTIRAHSTGPEQGAVFDVTLPTTTPAETLTPAPPQEAATHGSPLSILLVEDHADTANALQRLLKGCGYEVRSADSVASALNLVAQCDFDVLVSDLGLPDGSGIDLMRQIREHQNNSTPLRGIALTGFGMEDDIARTREAGFSEHITKPVNFQNLQRAIERVTSSA